MAKTKNRRLLGNVHPAILSVWAALMACAHLLPAVVLLGTGGTMSVSTILLPLAGIFFGPLAGGICAAIGQFIGFLIAPSGAWLGMFTWLVGTCTAVGAGFASRGKWYCTLGMLALGCILWYSTKIGRQAWIFPVVNGGYAVIAIIIGGFLGHKWLLGKNILLKGIAIFCISVGALLTTLILADVASIMVFKTPAISWKMLTFVSPVERTMFSLGAMVVGVPLLIGLPKVGIFVGPQDPNAIAEEEADDLEEEA